METKPVLEPKVCQASDGQRVVLRQPDPEKDLDRLVGFFERLPPEIRDYMRHDANDRQAVARRLAQVDNVSHWRLIADVDGEIVADATLDREPFNWSRHVAAFRPIIDPSHRRRGIRALLCRELIGLGRSAGVERLYTEVSPEQKGLIATLEGEGFAYEATRRKYAKGHDGRVHDIILMSSDLADVWDRLEVLMETLDGVHRHDGRY